MRRRRAEPRELSDVIGYGNDLAEFAMTIDAGDLFAPGTRNTLDEVTTASRSELHRRGRPLGERLFAERPDRSVDRIGAYWKATREYDTDL